MNQPFRWTTASIAVFIVCTVSFFVADIPIALWIQGHQNPESKVIFKLLTRFGQSEWYLVPGFLAFLVFRKQKPSVSRASLFVFSAVAVSGLAADLLKYLLPRARPGIFLDGGLYGFRIFPLMHGWDNAWNSFPSGHSATAFSAAAVFSILFPRFRILFFFAATLIAFSRIAVGKHYVSDVIAGSFLGLGTCILLHTLYFRDKPDEQALTQI
ncbi:MAG: phosphatase PAP2 family protein [Chlorobiaceae bacterium]|nr:phosphatase PAP2 family protein [Chlorobiaceae bacterium]NTV60454.1 phosphatase PAP2 family protein [Chlorobiaceae bacterium]